MKVLLLLLLVSCVTTTKKMVVTTYHCPTGYVLGDDRFCHFATVKVKAKAKAKIKKIKKAKPINEKEVHDKLVDKCLIMLNRGEL